MPNVTKSTRNFTASEFVGETLAIAGKEKRAGIKTKHGVRPAYTADVAVLSGDEAGLFFEDVLIFNTALISQIERADKNSHGEDKSVIGELLWVTSEDGERSYPLIEETTSVKVIALASSYGI